MIRFFWIKKLSFIIKLLSPLLLFFLCRSGNPIQTAPEYYAVVNLYLCNETNYPASFAIVYQNGFEIFSDTWNVKQDIYVSPGDCATVLITTWGPKIGKGYISAAFKKGKEYTVDTYSNHNSNRRQQEEFSVVSKEASLCLIAALSTEHYGEIKEREMFADCSFFSKTKFNLWFNKTSNVYEMTIYFQESGIQTSYKSSHTEER